MSSTGGWRIMGNGSWFSPNRTSWCTPQWWGLFSQRDWGESPGWAIPVYFWNHSKYFVDLLQLLIQGLLFLKYTCTIFLWFVIPLNCFLVNLSLHRLIPKADFQCLLSFLLPPVESHYSRHCITFHLTCHMFSSFSCNLFDQNVTDAAFSHFFKFNSDLLKGSLPLIISNVPWPWLLCGRFHLVCLINSFSDIDTKSQMEHWKGTLTLAVCLSSTCLTMVTRARSPCSEQSVYVHVHWRTGPFFFANLRVAGSIVAFLINDDNNNCNKK